MKAERRREVRSVERVEAYLDGGFIFWLGGRGGRWGVMVGVDLPEHHPLMRPTLRPPGHGVVVEELEDRRQDAGEGEREDEEEPAEGEELGDLVGGEV